MLTNPVTQPAHAWTAVVLAALIVPFATPSVARAAASRVPTGFLDQSMASSLSEPVGLAEVPDSPAPSSPRVLFIEQRTARVRLVFGGTLSTVGTVPNVASAESERGLLGIAVDPGWPARPYIYVHHTRAGGHVAISRFTLTGDLEGTGTGALAFDAATRYDLRADFDDGNSNHNGGTVRFGPDGMLYVSLGDDATRCPALDITFTGGKIMRLDVSRLPATGAGPAPYAILAPAGNPYLMQPDSSAMLVWTVGLRNPFRFSIDPVTGALFVADVGEGATEELSRVHTGGMNLGWPMFEGTAAFVSCSQTPPSAAVAPIHTYNHSQGAVIISAGLYRRPASGSTRFPAEYEGDAFFLDYVTGFMRRLKGSGTSWAIAPAVPGQPSSSDWGDGFTLVSDAVEMADGSLWYCRRANGGAGTGELRRIVAAPVLDVPSAVVPHVVFAPPHPSPSAGTVFLRWSQPASEPVHLVIYDLGGREVRVLQDGVVREAGAHEQRWDGAEASGSPAGPGIYFARLRVGEETRQVRITLLR